MEKSRQNHSGCACGCSSAKTTKKSRKVKLTLSILGAAIFIFALILGIFYQNQILSLSLHLASFLLVGYSVLFSAAKNIIKARFLDENFLMSLAGVCAFFIGEYPEAAALMLLYSLGEFLMERASGKSRQLISSLLDIRPDFASIESGGAIKKVDPKTVSIGDTIVVRAGEKIPLDGTVISGNSTLDVRAITGEALPISVKKGSEVLSGSVNLDGLIYIKVEKTFDRSTASKIIELVESAAEKKTKTENFFTSFARFYTPIVVAAALLIAVLPPLFISATSPEIWAEWLKRALVILVISCPCALVISIPLTYFCSLGASGKIGILAKGSNRLQLLARVETAVFDKTGTLTKGEFEVMSINPSGNFSQSDLLSFAAAAESFSTHPIARAIVKKQRENGEILDNFGKNPQFSEIAGKGIKANIAEYQILAGTLELLKEENIDIPTLENALNGVKTRVYVAVNSQFAGFIDISDRVRDEANPLLKKLKKMGVKTTVMITGDNEESAKSVADITKIDRYYAKALPQNKAEIVTKLMGETSKKGTLIFVGDGINDAPVLALSDVGIAMGGLGSDAAIEAADIVLMNDELQKIPAAIKIAKKTRSIVVQNIVFSLLIKAVFMVLGAFGLTPMWLAVLADVGTSLLATANALRIMHIRGGSLI